MKILETIMIRLSLMWGFMLGRLHDEKEVKDLKLGFSERNFKLAIIYYLNINKLRKEIVTFQGNCNVDLVVMLQMCLKGYKIKKQRASMRHLKEKEVKDGWKT